MTSFNSVGDQFRCFGESTSVRGIPRAIKSNDRKVCALWVGAVILSSCMMLWQVSAVFTRYFRYDIVTVFSEADVNAVFPDVTICDVYQLANLFTDSMTWSTYLNETRARYARWPLARVQTVLPNITSSVFSAVWSELLSKDGFYSSLPLDVSLTENSLMSASLAVLWCFTSDWNSARKASCIPGIELRWDPMYYKCVTVKIPDDLNTQIGSMSLVLYLNDFDQPGNKDSCCPNEFRSQSSGARVAIHDRKTPPSMLHALSVSPGTENTVALSALERHRLDSPYGSCTKEDHVGSLVDDIGYSVGVCQQICHQALAIKLCGCIDPQNSFTGDQLRSVNFTICGNQTSITDNHHNQLPIDLRGFQDLVCLASIKQSAQCSECLRPCFERRYEREVSTSGPWPNPVFQLDFFRRFIQKESYAARFHQYADLNEAVMNGSLTSQNAVEKVRGLDLITRNFMQINLVFDQPNAQILSDKPYMTIDHLLSSVGGALSLWLGVTVMFAFEVIELALNIVGNLYCSRWKLSLFDIV